MDGEPLAVIGDDSVTLRPLTGDERRDVEAYVRRLRREAWGLAWLVAFLPLLTIGTPAWGTWAIIIGLVALSRLSSVARAPARLRRAVRLRRDLGDGRLLVLVSSGRRVEVLAASGLPWREGEAMAAWRLALSAGP
jgi:hypothetical protein